ncbi:MAG: MotA/TolQ/ExbB proton channel family protein [Planctomycetota bacterium]|nr:MAG: MotA/TolQ/ExbB proton channel family protein [Planctomycetota bacterium]
MTTLVLAQDGATGGVWWLFRESFDAFTIILILGSFVAVTLIVRLALDTRDAVVAPDAPPKKVREQLDKNDPGSIERVLGQDDGIVASAVRAAWKARSRGRPAMREAAEIAGSNACGRWTRPVDILRTIGELGPLVGLAGTVWGMILAFVSLGETGGTAGPTDLSLGISKALFHTLLGLVLAIPCVLSASLFRARLDRHCNKAMSDALELVDRLPVDAHP